MRRVLLADTGVIDHLSAEPGRIGLHSPRPPQNALVQWLPPSDVPTPRQLGPAQHVLSPDALHAPIRRGPAVLAPVLSACTLIVPPRRVPAQHLA